MLRLLEMPYGTPSLDAVSFREEDTTDGSQTEQYDGTGLSRGKITASRRVVTHGLFCLQSYNVLIGHVKTYCPETYPLL